MPQMVLLSAVCPQLKLFVKNENQLINLQNDIFSSHHFLKRTRINYKYLAHNFINRLTKKPSRQIFHSPLQIRISTSHLQSHFSTQTPKPFRSTEKAQMNIIRTAHCNTLHSTFCSLFSSLELSTAIFQLSTSTPSGPDQITYPPSTISATFSSIYL